MIVDVDSKHGIAFAEGQVEAFVDDLAERLLAGELMHSPIGQAEIVNGIRLLVRHGKLPALTFRDVHTGDTVLVGPTGQLQNWPRWLPGDLLDSQLVRLLTPLKK